MGRDGRTSTQDKGVKDLGATEAVCLHPAIEAVARTMTMMIPLRRECRQLMARHVAGLADADDLHRYQMTRLRLLMLASANTGVRLPGRAAEVLADRSRLDFLALVGRGEPFPEPQPT